MALGATDGGQVADGGDGGQGLAPEAQGGNGLQIGGRFELRRGVTQEGQFDLIRRDAAAVVGDLDEFPAAATYLDVDGSGAGVEGVFYQFLDHRSRSLDHFASGDLGG